MGVGKGNRAALWSYNSANWLIAFFAIVRAGGTAVLLNYSMGCADAAELLAMTETGFLLCGDNGETKKDPNAMRALASLAGIPEEHCLDIRPASLDLGRAFPDVGEAPDARSESEAHDTAFLIFTSGTTSRPKAVQISQRALTFDADAFNGNIAEYAGRGVCVAVPLFHILGLLMSYAYLCRGATVCLSADYKPETLAREIDAYRISDMAAVGAVYLGLAEAPGFEDRVAPHLHLCMIAGGNLMNGYDKLPEETQPIDANGWLHTGDLGYFDEGGYLHLAGRIKDVIIRGGENISPSEIENALSRMDNIREAKVMGAPHPIYGESVEACITMADGGASFDQEAIKAALRAVLARFKVPSHVFLYDSFPLNVNGKLDQRSLCADMLMRIKRLTVDEELAGGVTVFDVVVKNSSYAIVPVTSLVSELAAGVGFNSRRALSIRLAVEEMLTERITDAYSAAGNIRVKITLMPEWLRVSFSDTGAEYFIDKRRDTSMSARIILKAVSDFHTDYPDGKPVYCMDFLYENEFSIQGFLLKSKGGDWPLTDEPCGGAAGRSAPIK